ncbi:ubiquitin-like domain-containing protein [Garciella nitratireducens]|uniref:Uncharacterized conserved protein YabE, contains G5 and tandem DUF348 domains n=1 Tax=Garciella nitratireducens DSM 15102 TaxID=1121911 RepID=A0A1T4NI77_9FIRM|nr:ubiquitin-like domain-containing protein [Garciella nitratireducens]SJZ78980.1 Uncharacterized conserved protein YabE, contains G5 and tandem DUF348 domains [Garciella nitratireducens DSM 15102]
MKKLFKKENLKQNKNGLLLIVLAVMVLSITAVGYALTFQNVTIIDEEKQSNIKTREKTVKEVLDQEDLKYTAEDSIKPALDSKVEDGMKIVIKRAVPVTIEVDGKNYELKTTADNVKEAIKEAGVELGEKDIVTPDLETKLEKNTKIHIQKAIPCSIEVDGTTKELLTASSTVEAVLKEEKITLGEKDKINPPLDQKIEKNMKIQVTRVTEKTITQEEKVPFKTIKKNTSSLNKGTTRVVQEGKNGIKENTIHIVYEDGKEISREVIESKVTQKPIDKIIKVGTKQQIPKVTSVSSRGTARRSATTRTLTVVATGYSSQDPGVNHVTSTGARLEKGVIAVDPSVIPYGSKIYVPGYGYGTALDTGGGIKGNRLDLAFNSRAEALNFGRRSVTIRIYQ